MSTDWELVLGSKPHGGRSFECICKPKKEKRNHLLRAPIVVAWVGAIKQTRVDEGKKCPSFVPIKMQATTVGGRREESLLYEPGSGLRLSKGRTENIWADKQGPVLTREYGIQFGNM